MYMRKVMRNKTKCDAKRENTSSTAKLKEKPIVATPALETYYI